MSKSDNSIKPASRLPAHKTRQSLAAFNLSGSMRIAFDTVCTPTGFVFVGFALSLGVAKENMGYISSLLSLACIFQMAGILLMSRVQDKRGLILRLRFLEPTLLIAAVLATPFLPHGFRFLFVAIVAFLAAATLHLSRPATDEWLASTIPEGVRGRYLGRSSQIASIAAIVSMLAVGYIAESIDKKDTFHLALLLACGGLFGILAVTALRRATMPDVSAGARMRWADLPEVARNRRFRLTVLGILGYNAPFWLCAPYHQVFYLGELKMRESTIAYITVGYFAVRVLLSPWFGRVCQRLGPRRLLWIVAPLYVPFFCGFWLCTPDRIWPVFLGWFLAGVADSGYGIAVQSATYAAIPETGARQAYFAIYNLAIFAAGGLGALLAVALVNLLKGASLTLGPFTLGQFHILYLICALIFVPCLAASQLFPGREKGR